VDAGLVKAAEVMKYQRLEDSDDWTKDPLIVGPGETFSYKITAENLAYDSDVGVQIMDLFDEKLFTGMSLGDVQGVIGSSLEVAKDGGPLLIADTDYSFAVTEPSTGIFEFSLNYGLGYPPNALLAEGETLEVIFDIISGEGFTSGVIENYADVDFFFDPDDPDRLRTNIVEAYPIPEPSSVFLIGLGLLGMFGVGRKFRKR
jgi:hypothetical protein